MTRGACGTVVSLNKSRHLLLCQILCLKRMVTTWTGFSEPGRYHSVTPRYSECQHFGTYLPFPSQSLTASRRKEKCSGSMKSLVTTWLNDRFGKYGHHARGPEPEVILQLVVGGISGPPPRGSKFPQNLPFPVRIRWLQAPCLCQNTFAGICRSVCMCMCVHTCLCTLKHNRYVPFSDSPVNCASV